MQLWTTNLFWQFKLERGVSNKIKIGVQPKLPYGTIGNVYSDKMNITNNQNYKYTCLSPPPSTTRGSVAAAYGTPNY